ncbi:ABC transporter domain-containing protein [Plasmodiophora brassicae]|nr:hypothetical protein PBRA_007108 [Plasmodiophora brassicae]
MAADVDGTSSIRRVHSDPSLLEMSMVTDADADMVRSSSFVSVDGGGRRPIGEAVADDAESQLVNAIGTNSLAAFDLSKMTTDAYKRLTLLQLDAGLIEQPSTLTYRSISYYRENRRVFEGVSGFLKPGMLVLGLGASDAGISSLLKVLARRQQGGSVRGDLRLNGVANPPDYRKVVSYVPFEDLHIGHMKVSEAIRFSLVLRASPLLPDRFIDFQVRVILHLLKLTHRANSLIGSATVRGISGGERRRLTIALEVAAGHAVFLMDGPTNGLDSNSAMELVSIARSLTDCGRAVMMSLVQVSPELFSKFDFIHMQSRGQMVYFGPTGQAATYMEHLGYVRPKGKTVPDFLSDISADPSRHYHGVSSLSDSIISFDAHLENVFRDGTCHALVPHRQGGTSLLLARSYRNSRFFEDLGRVLWAEENVESCERQATRISAYNVLDEIAQNACTRKLLRSELAKELVGFGLKTKFNSTLTSQFLACLRREIVMNVRETSKVISRVTRALIIALVCGTVFWQLDTSQAGARSRLGAIIVVAGFIGYDGLDEISQTFQSRALFYSQRNAGYYRVLAYFLANIIADLPILALQTMILTTITYPMIGMRDGLFSGRFVIFCMITFQLAIVSRSWTSFIANLIPNEAMAATVAVITNDLFWSCQGFTVPVRLIPGFLRWVNFVSYFTRVFQAYAINELDGLQLYCAPTDSCRWLTGTDLLTEHSLNSSGLSPLSLWGVTWVFVALFQLLSILCMTFLNFEARSGSDSAIGKEPSVELANLAPSDHVHVETRSETRGSLEAPSKDGSRLAFTHLTYTVGNRVLLHDISGFAQPGMMIAILGPSGAGKTTLLDILAMRKNTGTVDGDILINGQPRNERFRRYVAYVEQFDLLPSFATVREVIECSARLRLSKRVSPRNLSWHVDCILESLQLHSVANEIAVDLNPELRKRTSIGAELAALSHGSGILFLDEATTALDAPSAVRVVQAVRAISKDLPVLCTIHQPSSELFDLFNFVCLLTSGGRLAYFGPSALLPTFCADHGYPECLPGENLAEYALRTICSTAEVPPLPLNISGAVDDLPLPIFVDSPAEDDKPACSYSPSWCAVLLVLLRRRFMAEVRNASTMTVRLSMMFVFSIIIGCLFFQLPPNYDGVMSRLAFAFSMTGLTTWSQCSKISSIINERPCYYRELSVGMYSEAQYFIASCLAETPIIMAQVLITVIPAYMLAGLSLRPRAILQFVICIWICAEAAAGCVRFIVSLSPSVGVASGAAVTFFTVLTCFGGFLLVYSAMPKFSVVFFNISFFRFAIFYNFSGAVAGLNVHCTGRDGADCVKSVLMQYAVDPAQRHVYLACLVALAVGYRILAIIALKFVKHIKR